MTSTVPITDLQPAQPAGRLNRRRGRCGAPGGRRPLRGIRFLRPRGRAHATEGGFTLVEMLVALALLGALGLLMAGALQAGTAAWRRSLRLDEDAALRDSLRAALDRQLGQAQPLFVSPDPRDERVDFLGEPDAVTFLGPLPAVIAPKLIARQRLEVSLAAGALVLAWQVPGTAEAAALPVLEGVAALRLRYWSAPTPEDPGGWREDWRDRPRLPGLVALEVERRRAAPLAFVVAPRVTATPGCLYDPVGPACRRLP